MLIIHTHFFHAARRKLFILNWPKTQGWQWPPGSFGLVLIGLSRSFNFCVLKHMPYTRLVPKERQGSWIDTLSARHFALSTQPLCFSKGLPVMRIFFPVAPRPLGERERSAMLWSRLRWANGDNDTEKILFCTSVGSESFFFAFFPQVQIPTGAFVCPRSYNSGIGLRCHGSSPRLGL